MFKHKVLYDANSQSITDSPFARMCFCKIYIALEFLHLTLHTGQLLKPMKNSQWVMQKLPSTAAQPSEHVTS